MRPATATRVLHLISTLGAGGAERSLVDLLPLLRERGIESEVAVLRRVEVGFESGLPDWTPLHLIGGRSAPGRVLRTRALLRRVRPDVLHTSLIDADIVGRLAAAATGVKVLSSLVNPSYDPERLSDPNVVPWRLRTVQAIDGWTARHLTHAVHAISEAVADAAVRDLGIDRAAMTVVPRGRAIDPLAAPSRAAARRELGIEPDAEVVLHLGRQEHQKDVPTLVRAVAVVAARRPGLRLLQAGRRGAATRLIEDAILETGVAERVALLGFRADVDRLLAASDVFVFTSRFEGLGGSLIEAMGAGLPIVATDLPAIREVVEPGRSADVVPVGDAGAVASAIEALLDEPARRSAYGSRGRAIYEERFTLDRSADALAALLHDVAGR